MYPFYVLGIAPEATDEEVAERYHGLVREFPPDRAPEAFARIRTAWEALRKRRARVRARLFYFDDTGRALEGGASTVEPEAPRRLSADGVARLLRGQSGA